MNYIISEEEYKELKFLIDTKQYMKAKQKIFNLKKLKQENEK